MEFLKGTITPKDWAYSGGIIALAVLLGATFFFLIYRPQMGKLQLKQAEVQQRSTALRDAKDTKANIETLQAKSDKMEQLVSLFENRLPEKREILRLVERFERLGAQLGLKNVSLNPGGNTEDAKKETISYNVKASGTFHKVVGFINLLEREERYLKISEIDIKEEKDGISEASFRLSTFTFKQPTEEKS